MVFAAVNPSTFRPPRPRRRAAAIAGLAVLSLGVLGLATLDASVLCTLPALVLFVALAVRRYPGERVLLLLGEARRKPTRRAPASTQLAHSEVAMPRGGLLLACSLAVRPPPATSLAGS